MIIYSIRLPFVRNIKTEFPRMQCLNAPGDLSMIETDSSIRCCSSSSYSSPYQSIKSIQSVSSCPTAKLCLSHLRLLQDEASEESALKMSCRCLLAAPSG